MRPPLEMSHTCVHDNIHIGIIYRYICVYIGFCNGLSSQVGVDADWNDAEKASDAAWGFQFFEQTFCAFFTIELFIRFGRRGLYM